MRLEDSFPVWATSASAGDLFCAGPWFEHFATAAIRPDETAKFLQCARPDGADPIALALKVGRGEVFPRPTLLESMASYYSCGYGPMAASAPKASALRDLIDALALAARPYDGLRIGPLDRTSTFATIAAQRLAVAGYRTFWTHAFFNWYADTRAMRYADYLQRVESTFPATSDKRRRAFLRKGNGTITIAESPEQLQQVITDYEQVYAASWKVPEPFEAFMPGLIRLAASQGWLRMGILRVGGEPAAAQLWFVADGRALIYKVAYDERFAKLSVGSMLTCAMLERVIDVDRVDEVDFLSGDDDYKAKWMFARRERHTLLAFNQLRWRGLAGGLREWLGQRRGAAAPTAEPAAAPSVGALEPAHGR